MEIKTNISKFFCLTVLVVYHRCYFVAAKYDDDYVELDILNPYATTDDHNDHKRTHRYVRECPKTLRNNATFETIKPRNTSTEFSVKYFYHKFSGNRMFGHHAIVKNPLEMVSVLEPAGGCKNKSISTVADTASKKHCDVATNAGFFDNERTHKTFGRCIGNIVSDSKMVLDAKGVQNANFGIRKDGSVVIGYLSREDVTDKNNPFVQLVSGVGWLIRNGKSYLKESLKAECKDSQQTGNLKRFFDVISARTAIGVDAEGFVHLVTFDGKTDERGLNLAQFVEYLLSINVTNAINLDGGGSATFVLNETVVNYPSDKCKGGDLCPRKVSSIICVQGRKTLNLPEKIESLSYCCNRNYLLVVGLTVVIGISLLLHVHFYSMYQFHRQRVHQLLSGQQQKEALESLLNDDDGLSGSGFDTEDDMDGL